MLRWPPVGSEPRSVSPAGLPAPQVSEQGDPDPGRMQMLQGNPLLLPHSLQELLAKDTVQVALVPERKGLFLKHVEYEVSSQVWERPCEGGGLGRGVWGRGQGAAESGCWGES